jgi:hypothetical protein
MRGLDAKHNFAIARSKHDEIKNPQSFLTVAIESAVKHIDCLMICSNNHELVLKNIINFHQQTLLSYTLKFVSVGFISKPSYLTTSANPLILHTDYHRHSWFGLLLHLSTCPDPYPDFNLSLFVVPPSQFRFSPVLHLFSILLPCLIR